VESITQLISYSNSLLELKQHLIYQRKIKNQQMKTKTAKNWICYFNLVSSTLLPTKFMAVNHSHYLIQID